MQEASNVLIFRTVTAGVAAIVKILNYDGRLTRAVDYRTFTEPDSALGAVYRGPRPQILLMDSFVGDMSAAIEFAQMALTKNPKLFLILFAHEGENHQLFDMILTQFVTTPRGEDEWWDKLVACVEALRTGELKRGWLPPKKSTVV